MTLTVSPSHLNCPPLHADLDAVLANARDGGIGYMLCVSVTLESFPEILAIAERYPHVFASVGVHPNEREGQEPTVEALTELAHHERVVALGETGLDYYRTKDETAGDMRWQQD